MTDNPREQAIEKLARILISEIDKLVTEGYSEKDYPEEAASRISKLALDALNVGVVSKESEPQEGDLVKSTHKNLPYDPSYWRYESGSEDNKRWNHQVLQRNGKPAVYVENIGVKL